MISAKLTEFFQEWLNWATQDKVVDTFHFNKDIGLCACLSSFTKGDVGIHAELIKLLEDDFKGNYQFPFDKNLQVYWEAKRKALHYKNPKRVAWVKQKLGL